MKGSQETTKTGQIRHVPINKSAFEALKRLRDEKRSLDYVLVDRSGRAPDIQHVCDRLFKNAIERGGVKTIRFHDLRATFAANFMMKGGNIYTLSKILGHSSVDMTAKKYAHLHPQYLKEASEIVDFKADSKASGHLAVVRNV